MKPPWLDSSQETAELEALQTDVMRFVAILGLCLAAIFSLVHSAAQERAPQERATQERATQERATEQARPIEERARSARELIQPEKKIVPPAVVAAREKLPEVPIPQTQYPAAQKGFTLEFASVQALRFLLQDGQVQLYAKVDNQFWSINSQGDFSRAEAPASYYQMHDDTVPQQFRTVLAALEVGGVAEWGVALPATMVGQVQQLTASREGGNLLIAGDGTVRVSLP